MSKSRRSRAEKRVEIGNEQIRVDFDARTSDTMYNYVWVRQPETGEWERVHNFGIDVRSYRHDNGELINCIGMDLDVEREGGRVRVGYPEPLIQYRQFDDKIGSEELIRRYPDQKREEFGGLVHAEASAEFEYEVDDGRPSYVVRGRVLKGRVLNVVYIVSALWTDNHALPTHVYYEGFPEYDTTRPEGNYTRDVEVENVAYVIFYRADGNGVPFALLPKRPGRAGVCNYFDNWKCLYDFRASCLNQEYVPEEPAVKGCNDTGYITEPKEGGMLDGVRVVFFPEYGRLRGGLSRHLRDRIEEKIKSEYADAAVRDRRGLNLPPRLTLSAPASY